MEVEAEESRVVVGMGLYNNKLVWTAFEIRMYKNSGEWMKESSDQRGRAMFMNDQQSSGKLGVR